MRNVLARLMLLFLLVGIAPQSDAALAQTTCGSGCGNTASSVEVNRITVANNDIACRVRSSRAAHYDNPASTLNYFSVWLPGGAARSGANNPVKINVENTSGNDLNVTTISCPGGMVGGGGTTVGTVTLPDGGSCLLYVFWDHRANAVSFSGATLSRTGNT